jgi:hypothetical protein
MNQKSIIFDIPKNFNWKTYLKLNPDLKFSKKAEALKHYIKFGKLENRIYEINLPDDFNWETYLFLNPDVLKTCKDKYSAINHYIKFGLNEKREYLIQETNYKEQFRELCLNNINYIRQIDLPEFEPDSNLESVLIEYRCLPHIEFLIRNTILKLGSNWSYTIVCGNFNYNFMIDMCSKISPKINVIKTNYDNMLPSEYNIFLSSLDFWNLLKGEKILLYQEDSLIFKKNVNDFLYWDYIGAPWPSYQNDNKSCVGNGGISLRTKKIMIKIINSINIKDTNYNSSTLKYIKDSNLTCPPEDVYFTKNMEDLNIGLLADNKSASNFSTESIFNSDSFAGHNFWLCDKNWVNRIYKNCMFQLKPMYEIHINKIQHRGGWKSVLQNLITNNFFYEKSDVCFFDTTELYFLINKDYCCENKWTGIIHWTPNTPDYLSKFDINIMFSNKNFITSLNNCICLFTLSNYITKFIEQKLKELNLNINIVTIKHPIDTNDITLLWDLDSYNNNNSKKIIQIGQQLRNVTSIFKIPSNSHNKMWLTGTKKIEDSLYILNRELNNYNLSFNDLKYSNVEIYYANSFEEYDTLLSNNIVFLDLIDAGANNALLECIIRNTPIIVNKIEPVIEYLGEKYPLYFTKLDDVKDLLSIEKITEAHNYLTKMDKSDLLYSKFNNFLFNKLYQQLN